MDLLKLALAGVLTCLCGCLDPFAPSTPEDPSSLSTDFAKTWSQVPQRFAQTLQERNSKLLGGFLDDQATLSSQGLPSLDQAGLRLCVQRLASIEPSSRLRWWNSPPSTSTGTTFGSSDTVDISLDYRLERLSADSSRIDTLARQANSTWTVRRANPSEWRLVHWSDPAEGNSFLKLCSSLQ